MAATDFQKDIARALAPNRSKDSAFHGSFALSLFCDIGRDVHDIDILCQPGSGVFEIRNRDISLLRRAGFKIIDDPSGGEVYSATIEKDGQKQQIQWFFPKNGRRHDLIHNNDYGFVFDPRDILSHKLLRILLFPLHSEKHYRDLIYLSSHFSLADAMDRLIGIQRISNRDDIFKTIAYNSKLMDVDLGQGPAGSEILKQANNELLALLKTAGPTPPAEVRRDKPTFDAPEGSS